MVKKWLAMKNVEYKEVNLDEEPAQREYVQKMSGSSTVPVVVIEDKASESTAISIGYKPAQLATIVA